MKIAVLSRNRKLYSTRRIIEAAEARGHEVKVVDVLRCYMNVTSHKPSVHYRGENLDDFDAGNSAYRCIGNVLWDSGVAPV